MPVRHIPKLELTSAKRTTCRLRTFACAAEPAKHEASSDHISVPDPRPKPKVDVGIDVADYVQKNYKFYAGDAKFLSGPTENTQQLWKKLEALLIEELDKGQD